MVIAIIPAQVLVGSSVDPSQADERLDCSAMLGNPSVQKSNITTGTGYVDCGEFDSAQTKCGREANGHGQQRKPWVAIPACAFVYTRSPWSSPAVTSRPATSPRLRRSLSAAISEPPPPAISSCSQSRHWRSPAPSGPHPTSSPSPDTSFSSFITRRLAPASLRIPPSGRRGRSPGCPQARTGSATSRPRSSASSRSRGPVGRGRAPSGFKTLEVRGWIEGRGHEHNRCIQCGPSIRSTDRHP